MMRPIRRERHVPHGTLSIAPRDHIRGLPATGLRYTNAMDRTPEQAPPLLGAEDPPPFEIINPAGIAPVILLCDHASSAIPRSLATLGLGPAELALHIGWDSGAASVTRVLSARLDAPAVFAGYSRLVIDPNRKPGHENSIPAMSDGIHVPGNAAVTLEEAARRRDAVFHPYHNAVKGVISRIQARGPAPAIISMHSFTPEMDGFVRPWHISVMWNQDPRIPVPLLAALRKIEGLVIGDNQPYSGRLLHDGYTTQVHATAGGLPYAQIEIRKDMIRTPEGVNEYARILGDALEGVLADPEIHRTEVY